MKNKNVSRFTRGKLGTIMLLAASVGVCLYAIKFTEPNSTQMLALTVASLALLAAAFWVCIRYCKCPYCGKTILGKILTTQYCPHCNRSLNTGAKKIEGSPIQEHAWQKPRGGKGGKKR